jgi:hypothetical protein
VLKVLKATKINQRKLLSRALLKSHRNSKVFQKREKKLVKFQKALRALNKIQRRSKV